MVTQNARIVSPQDLSRRTADVDKAQIPPTGLYPRAGCVEMSGTECTVDRFPKNVHYHIKLAAFTDGGLVKACAYMTA
jgi:hypothetical protein